MARQTLPLTQGGLPPLVLRRTLAMLVASLFLTCAASAQDAGGGVPLRLGQPFERELRGGQAHAYLIEVATGHYLRVSVEQLGVDVRAVMLAPGGRKWAEADSAAGTQGKEKLFGVAEEAGSFRLEVRPAHPDGAGKYRVRLEGLRAPTELDTTMLAASRTYQEAVRLADEGSKESLQRAVTKYEEALWLYRAAGGRRDEANVLNHLGSTLSSPGEKQKALVYYSQALPLSRASGDRYGEANILASLGSLAVTRGQRENALKFYQGPCASGARSARDAGRRDDGAGWNGCPARAPRPSVFSRWLRRTLGNRRSTLTPAGPP